MEKTKEYYRIVREIICKVMPRLASPDEDVREQYRARGCMFRDSAQNLMRIQTAGVGLELARHVESWAKHFQKSASTIEERIPIADRLMDEFSSGRGFVRSLLFDFFGLDEEKKQDNAKSQRLVSSQIRKESKLLDERDLLEAKLDRLGMAFVDGFRRRDFFLFQHWDGPAPLDLVASVIGPNDRKIRDAVKALPQKGEGARLELHRSLSESMVVATLSSGKPLFLLKQVRRKSPLLAKPEDVSVGGVINILLAYTNDVPSWDSQLKWLESLPDEDLR